MAKTSLPLCLAAIALFLAAATIPAQAGPGELLTSNVARTVQRSMQEVATTLPSDSLSTEQLVASLPVTQTLETDPSEQPTVLPDVFDFSQQFASQVVSDTLPLPVALPVLAKQETIDDTDTNDDSASTDGGFVAEAVNTAVLEPLMIQTLALKTVTPDDSSVAAQDADVIKTAVTEASKNKVTTNKKPQCEVACEKDRKTCQKTACNRKGNMADCKQQCETVSHRCVHQCQKNAARHTCFGTCGLTHIQCGNQCQKEINKKQHCFTDCTDTQSTCNKKCKGHHTCELSCNTTQKKCNAKCALKVGAMKTCWAMCDTTQAKCSNQCNKIH